MAVKPEVGISHGGRIPNDDDPSISATIRTTDPFWRWCTMYPAATSC